MKASLIFLLIALYGAVAQEDTSSSEEAAVATSASASSSSDIGATVQAVLDNVADLTHAAVVNGSAKFNSSLDTALNLGTELVGKAALLQQSIVANLTSAAQGMADKGIEQLTQIQASLQSSPFGSFISPLLAMKIQGLKLAQQGMGVAGKMEAAKGALVANAAIGAAGAARGVSSAAINAATSGSTTANGVAKQVNSQIGAGISALGSRFGAGLTSAMSAGSSLSGRLSSSSSSGLSGSLSSFLG